MEFFYLIFTFITKLKRNIVSNLYFRTFSTISAKEEKFKFLNELEHQSYTQFLNVKIV